MNNLSGKTIIVGVTGGISAYKVPFFVRELKKKGAIVKVILTENAKNFVSDLVLSVFSDAVFDSLWKAEIPHISLTKEADLFIVAPADYNIIGKVSSGIADDLLSSAIAAYEKKLLFFPSMSDRMFENPIFQKNIDCLRECGHLVIDPSSGPLACGKIGKGRLPSISRLVLEAEKAVTPDLLKGAFCLITGGGTIERIDPVRYLTNASSGKMAYSLARFCYLTGGKVRLILGENTHINNPDFPYEVVRVKSARELYEKIVNLWEKVDYLFMSAAVSDFTVDSKEQKIKKTDEINLKLKRNIDILEELKNKKEHQFVIGFSLETENLKNSTLEKMKEKKCDIMVGNYPESIGRDTTSGVIVTASEEQDFECTKDELAWRIIKLIKEEDSEEMTHIQQ